MNAWECKLENTLYSLCTVPRCTLLPKMTMVCRSTSVQHYLPEECQWEIQTPLIGHLHLRRLHWRMVGPIIWDVAGCETKNGGGIKKIKKNLRKKPPDLYTAGGTHNPSKWETISIKMHLRFFFIHFHHFPTTNLGNKAQVSCLDLSRLIYCLNLITS